MQKVSAKLNPEFMVDEKGHKKAVVLKLREYENLMELIEDLEDANGLLKAEREATSFIPYDEFRKTWLTN